MAAKHIGERAVEANGGSTDFSPVRWGPNATVRWSEVRVVHDRRMAASDIAPSAAIPLIVPTPRLVIPGIGAFVIERDTAVRADGPAIAVAELLVDLLAPATGWRLAVARGGVADGITLLVDDSRADLGAEGYHLVVADAGVTVVAAGVAGLRWAVQTLRQLLPPEIYAADSVSAVPWKIPAVEVIDVPRFGWRGVMLDVARWFRPLPQVRRLIELAAAHKLNVLHLHLTDDQGWRFESRRHPRLTEVGAWRRESMAGPAEGEVFDGEPHGGYYTQSELRELGRFAARLGVTVVPEIDVPGHMLAAIAAYPELGNDPGRRLEVGTRWGVIDEVLNVEESTVEFVIDVLDEVLDVFPGRYVHVGGDECPRTEWAASPRARARRDELGLTSDDQLQAWFIGRLAEHLNNRGRRLIGWDEILDGGIAGGATVMSWRGETGGIAAARAGHDVVMSPENVVYLDHYQGDPATEPWAPRGNNTLRRIPSYDPVPSVLDAEQAAHVLGVQANVWVEYIPTAAHLDYMVFPRLCAVAEIAWGATGRDAAAFERRLGEHLRRLDVLGVGYREPRR